MCSGTREEGLTIVQSERWKLEGTELRQGDRGYALLFSGSSSSLWFEQNPLIMRKLFHPCRGSVLCHKRALSGLRRSGLIPRAHVKKFARSHILIILKLGTWRQVDPRRLTSQSVCVVMGMHAHTHRKRETDRDRH